MTKYFKHVVAGTILIYFICLVSPRAAYAYLDPGTGSYILQLVMAFLLGGSLVIRIYWKKIKTYFANFLSKKQKDDA